MEKESALTGAPAVADAYEAQLVARAKERVPQAWDEIYARNYPPVYRYIRARVFEESAAEDLASSVFLAAVKGIGAYRYNGQPVLAWLYRIARNVVSNHQRAMFRQRTLSVGGVLQLPGRVFGHTRKEDPAGPPATDPGSMVEQMDLREALAELPESQREALVLKFFVGLDATEIAAIMGKDPAAIYSLQVRGLHALRRRLG
jgi:RNA polymerase sigma-70 factor (ECF subfamily)